MMATAPTVKVVYVDGVLDAHLSDLRALPKGIEWTATQNHLSLFLAAETSFILIEEHFGHATQKNEFETRMDIELSAGAQLNYLKWQHLPMHTHCDAFLQVIQSERSTLRAGFFSSGSECERQRVAIEQRGSAAESSLYGFCQPICDEQHLDHAVDILHAAPLGRSRMLYKGILDAQSKASFRGRVKVAEAGKGTVAHQGNHYLLLSPLAEASSRPELEIYQEDVQCSHGATVGQLDEAALFYLRARGIDKESAQQLLRHAFAADLFEYVPVSFASWLRQGMGYADEV